MSDKPKGYTPRKTPPLWLHVIALFRLSKKAVCTASEDMGIVDYHDYSDSDDLDGKPIHFFHYTCRRCGKRFII